MKITNLKRNRGFSLVEVTIAMAIAAVALVSIIGMLPQGMQTMRDAGDRAIEARIHQQILGELQMTPFGDSGGSPLDDYNNLEIYYDAQGEEIGDMQNNASVKGSFEHIYTARVTVPREGQKLPETVGGASFSGFQFTKGDQPNTHLRPALVEVAAVGGRGDNFDWEADENKDLISVYQSYVVKMGQDLN